jgi:hypothetical protein
MTQNKTPTIIKEAGFFNSLNHLKSFVRIVFGLK